MPTEFKNGRPQIVRRPDDLPQPVPKPPGRKRRTTKVTLGSQLATDPHADTPWAAYARLAEEFRTHQCKQLAEVGGGTCGAAASSMVASASLQLAASRWIFDQAAKNLDPALMLTASRLANDSRQNLLAAYEMVVREAKVRKEFEKHSPHVALVEALNSNIGNDK